MTVDDRLAELGVTLPGPYPPHEPLDAVVIHGGVARTSGQLPRDHDGRLVHPGTLGVGRRPSTGGGGGSVVRAERAVGAAGRARLARPHRTGADGARVRRLRAGVRRPAGGRRRREPAAVTRCSVAPGVTRARPSGSRRCRAAARSRSRSQSRSAEGDERMAPQITIIGGGSYQWVPKLARRPRQHAVARGGRRRARATSTRRRCRAWSSWSSTSPPVARHPDVGPSHHRPARGARPAPTTSS